MGHRSWRIVGGCVCASLMAGGAVGQPPPFFGTAFVDPDVILASDWSALETLSYVGLDERLVFDRRANDFLLQDMHLFAATFADDLTIEVQVNPEFGDSTAAEVQAALYAESVGRLPTSLRAAVETMWIHDGFEPFGGGNNNLLIHVDQAVDYGVYLEEVLFHEATHTSYDADHAAATGWLAAQDDDPTFISEYAEDNPDTEDVAESLLMWFALRYRSDRIDGGTSDAIEAAIPNRLAYFDSLTFLIVEPPLLGDFNANGTVDAADYTVWRDNLGGSFDLNGNGDESGDSAGVVDTADYALWKANFGDDGSGAGAAAHANALPEPSMAWLMASGLLAVVLMAGRCLGRSNNSGDAAWRARSPSPGTALSDRSWCDASWRIELLSPFQLNEKSSLLRTTTLNYRQFNLLDGDRGGRIERWPGFTWRPVSSVRA